MPIICRPHNLLFIMAPRTGCTAIGELLCRELAGEYLPECDLVRPDGSFRIQRKHGTLAELLANDLLTHQEAAALFRFTAVRNPFDSLVSLYVKKRSSYQHLLGVKDAWIYKVPGYVEDMDFCREHTFEEWILRKYRRPWLARTLKPRPRGLSRKYAEGVDFVMRYERLQEDFSEALRRGGVDRSLVVERINPTKEKQGHYRDYYTAKARRVVESAFAWEFERYGYTY